MIRLVRYLGFLALAVVLAGCDLPSESRPAVKPDKKGVKNGDGPAAKVITGNLAKHRVEKGPFKIEVSVNGLLEAEEMTEVAFKPESKSPEVRAMLTVLKAVEHGTAVHKGDTLLTIDTSKIDQTIRDLTNDQALAKLTLKLAEEELPLLEKSTPVDLAAAERAKKQADEDLQKFLKVDRDAAIKSARFSVKSSAHYLEYSKEELRQLEKMYRADDLREETEEIILKRQRHAVESAEFSLKRAQMLCDQIIKIDMPRKEQTLKDSLVKLTQALDKAKATLPLTLTQKRLTLEKLKYDHAKAVTRLARLHKAREAMTIKAPVDGIVYHGKCQRGQWNTATAAAKVQPGGSVSADEVILTIVNPRPLFVRAMIEEKDVQNVRPGCKGKAVATAYPSLKLPAKVDKVSAIPTTPGQFETRIALEVPKDAGALMPGMACTVKLVPYVQAIALTVPAGAVFTDELDDDKHFVYLAGKAGKAEKKWVTVGKSFGGKVEIVEGLEEGAEIMLEKPAETAKPNGGGKKASQ